MGRQRCTRSKGGWLFCLRSGKVGKEGRKEGVDGDGGERWNVDGFRASFCKYGFGVESNAQSSLSPARES